MIAPIPMSFPQPVLFEPQSFYRDLLQQWLIGASIPIQQHVVTTMDGVWSLPDGPKQLLCRTESFESVLDPTLLDLLKETEIVQLNLIGGEPRLRFCSIKTFVLPPSYFNQQDVLRAMGVNPRLQQQVTRDQHASLPLPN